MSVEDPRPILDESQRLTLRRMRDEATDDLLTNILPFYAAHALDEAGGGFVGEIDVHGRPLPEADKGVVLTSRILWTFSRAFGLTGDPGHLHLAERASDALDWPFWDRRHDGVFGRVDRAGTPLARAKRTYDQGFALFGLAEFSRATGDGRSLERAIAIHRRLERHTYDARREGYVDVRTERWSRSRRDRLLLRNRDTKSMNCHLHLLEAYTVLLSVWDDPGLRRSQHRLVDLIVERFFDRGLGHFRQDVDTHWRSRSDEISYGHDLETCWLLVEALDRLGDHPGRARILELTLDVARLTARQAIDDDGGVPYRGDAGGVVDRQKIWWTQAESVVGFLDAFERSGDPDLLTAAAGVWAFIRRELVDRDVGEWRSAPGGSTSFPEYNVKIGPMKGPYHNGRACMEVMARADRMLATA